MPRISVGLWGETESYGSLVASAVHLDEQGDRAILALGLPAAKTLAPGRSAPWARKLRMVLPTEVVKLSPRKYNSLLSRWKHRDLLLDFCYRKSIESLIKRYPSTRTVVFGLEAVAFAVLATEVAGNLSVDMVYRGPSSPDPGTTAATLLARATFEKDLEATARALKVGEPFAQANSKAILMDLLERWGKPGVYRAFKRDSPEVQDILRRHFEASPGN